MVEPGQYFERLAAAFVRGKLGLGALPAGDRNRLFIAPLSDLSPEEYRQLIEWGIAQGLRVQKFKRTMGLRRVERVLGILRSFRPGSLLDIGSGRGAFLWPLLDEFAELPVTAVDILPHRVADLKAVVRGGLSNLAVLHANATSLPFDAAAFELVTMLEVLEHIPDARAALAEVCRVAARAIVLSVPSKPDSNPEHIHLFGEAALRELFREAGVHKVRFEHVLNHRIAVAIKEA